MQLGTCFRSFSGIPRSTWQMPGGGSFVSSGCGFGSRGGLQTGKAGSRFPSSPSAQLQHPGNTKSLSTLALEACVYPTQSLCSLGKFRKFPSSPDENAKCSQSQRGDCCTNTYHPPAWLLECFTQALLKLNSNTGTRMFALGPGIPVHWGLFSLLGKMQSPEHCGQHSSWTKKGIKQTSRHLTPPF